MIQSAVMGDAVVTLRMDGVRRFGCVAASDGE